MKRQARVGSGFAGSVHHRMRQLAEDGLSKDEIRDILIGEGAKPSTVDTYIKNHIGADDEKQTDRVRTACDLHLADLRREHQPDVAVRI